MAPKKKPNKGEGENVLWDDFVKKYIKMQREFDTPPIHNAKEIMRLIDEGEDVKKWSFDRDFDAMAFRVLWNSLRAAGYVDIEAIWLWKCGGGDESVRSVCGYLEMEPPPAVKDLQFMDNGVGELGCEFLGQLLGPTGNKVVNKLLLDHNHFGTPGLQRLSAGLSQNSTLRQLSLNYCAIAEDGGEALAHILMFVRGALEVLELRGNYLRERGVCDIFHGAKRAKSLCRLDVFDNKFSDTPEVIKALRELFATNLTLTHYDLAGNQISDSGAGLLVNGMIGKEHLQAVKVTERCNSKTFEALEFQLAAGKGKKGKKRK